MSDIKIEEGVVVAKGGDRDLKANILRPANQSGPVPGILILPGGGFRNADRTPLAERYGLALASDGYVCVTAEYRVMDEAPWPAQVQDVKAEGIDPDLIVVAGKSAGGLLALVAAGSSHVKEFDGDGGNPGVSSKVAAVVGMSPVSDISERAVDPAFEPLFGKNPSADLVRAANAITYANKDYPPALFFHGTSDTRVHHSTTMRMYEALEQAGVPVDLHLFAGEDHFFDREPRFYKATTDSIAIFISRYVPVREAVAAS
jgi:acetyl esterase/lipase